MVCWPKKLGDYSSVGIPHPGIMVMKRRTSRMVCLERLLANTRRGRICNVVALPAARRYRLLFNVYCPTPMVQRLLFNGRDDAHSRPLDTPPAALRCCLGLAVRSQTGRTARMWMI
jgi:hypothetical protein